MPNMCKYCKYCKSFFDNCGRSWSICSCNSSEKFLKYIHKEYEECEQFAEDEQIDFDINNVKLVSKSSTENIIKQLPSTDLLHTNKINRENAISEIENQKDICSIKSVDFDVLNQQPTESKFAENKENGAIIDLLGVFSCTSCQYVQPANVVISNLKCPCCQENLKFTIVRHNNQVQE